MRDYFIKHRFDIAVIFCFAVFTGISFILPFKAGIEIITLHFKSFILEMIAFLPLLFILIGLFDVWVPKELVIKHIGKSSGIKGTFLVILLATLQAGPLYAAFPVAALLWKKGCSVRNIFTYLGAFTALKIPMLTFEISFLGLKFSLLRTIITIPVFVIIAILMEKYLKNKKFEIKDVSLK